MWNITTFSSFDVVNSSFLVFIAVPFSITLALCYIAADLSRSPLLCKQCRPLMLHIVHVCHQIAQWGMLHRSVAVFSGV